MAIGFMPSTPGPSRLPQTVTDAATSVSSPSTSNGPTDAASVVDRFLQVDNNFPQYHDLLRCSPGCPSVSGLREADYPSLREYTSTMRSISHVAGVTTTPLPHGLEDQLNHMQQQLELGLFPEINRAWIVIDSNFFLWSYDNGGDIAFYDRLTEIIYGVGLVKPKKGVFKEHISHLLILTTTSEIHILGVMTTDSDDIANVNVINDPLFTLPTDNVPLKVIVGTDLGRIFLGGRNGCLYEVVYTAERGWFGRQCQKVNHSASILSSIVPQFLQFSGEDAIEQIEIDNSRHILYTRSEAGSIEVYDLGSDGTQTSKVTSLSAHWISREASNIARTVDPSNFANIVHICAIEETESTFLHLMAVTEAGVRLFFSATKSDYLDPRPSGLNLVHIRLPPGFSGASGIQRPSRVHLCHHRRGTTIMLSPQSQENDMLWLLTNDPFPFVSELMEVSCTHSLSGRIWNMIEETKTQIVRPLTCIRVDGSGRAVAVEPPLIVTQGMEEQRKFLFISTSGVSIVYKPRPIDHLKKVLTDNQGFDNEAVKGFFMLYGELQAACTALSLACATASIQDQHLSEWATLAFFKYAKELEVPQSTSRLLLDQTPTPHLPSFPRAQLSSPVSPYQPHISSPDFHPQHVSSPTTPHVFSSDTFQIPSHTTHAGDVTEMSARHNSLYLYFSRVVRPVWNYGVVIQVPSKNETGSNIEVLSSSVSGQELMLYIEKLKSLRAFMVKNIHLHSGRNSYSQPLLPITSAGPSTSVIREQTSLNNLLALIDSSLEIFGLWKVLHDHHFYSAIGNLDQDFRYRLKSVTFRELIVGGSDICAKLASSLVQKFIDDNDTTDAISGKLNEACPSIFKQENALFAKAQEKVIKARSNRNHIEREQQIDEAASLFKRIGGRLDLRAASALLRSVGAYKHLIDLCISTAALRDPQQLAVHYYRNYEPSTDYAGANAFVNRMDCYTVLLEAFQELIEQSRTSIQRLSPQDYKKLGLQPLDINREEAATLADCLLREAMESPDELLHVACYDWLFAHQMNDRLLHIRSPFLEEYLKRKTSNSTGESTALMDLLWMFYERNGHYRPAAEILCKLAERHGTDVDLNKRREYLSRAIVCMKSQNSLSLPESETKHSGEFLHELEEKMDVVRLQVQLLEAVRHRPDCEDIVVKLNADLLDITQLFEVAESGDLPENQLSIIYTANHEDVVLIEGFWQKILDKTLDAARHENLQTTQLLLENKLTNLAQIYLPSQNFYPVPFIVFYLESKAPLLQLPASWLAQVFINHGYPLPNLVDIYHRLYRARGPNHSWAGKEIQLLRILHFIIKHGVTTASSADRLAAPKWLDNLSGYLLDLQAKPSDVNVRGLITDFEQLRTQLDLLTRGRAQ